MPQNYERRISLFSWGQCYENVDFKSMPGIIAEGTRHTKSGSCAKQPQFRNNVITSETVASRQSAMVIAVLIILLLA